MGETGEGRAQLGPTFISASWRSMGEMGRAVRSQRPDLPFLRAGAAWEKQGRAVRSQRPDLLFCELAQHGRTRGGPCAARGPTFLSASWRSMGEPGRAVRSKARPSFLRAGAAWEKWGGPCAARPDLPFLRAGAAWENQGRAVRSQRPDLPFLRAGAAWENQGRAVRSQRPDLPFCELAKANFRGSIFLWWGFLGAVLQSIYTCVWT